MKKVRYVISASISLMAIACSNKNTDTREPTPASVIGIWNVVKLYKIDVQSGGTTWQIPISKKACWTFR